MSRWWIGLSVSTSGFLALGCTLCIAHLLGTFSEGRASLLVQYGALILGNLGVLGFFIALFCRAPGLLSPEFSKRSEEITTRFGVSALAFMFLLLLSSMVLSNVFHVSPGPQYQAALSLPLYFFLVAATVSTILQILQLGVVKLLAQAS